MRLPVVIKILEQVLAGSSWMRLIAPASLRSACETFHSLPDLPLNRKWTLFVDVCNDLEIRWCNSFQMLKDLNFRTGWRSRF
jgi:hypothetical protein